MATCGGYWNAAAGERPQFVSPDDSPGTKKPMELLNHTEAFRSLLLCWFLAQGVCWKLGVVASHGVVVAARKHVLVAENACAEGSMPNGTKTARGSRESQQHGRCGVARLHLLLLMLLR